MAGGASARDAIPPHERGDGDPAPTGDRIRVTEPDDVAAGDRPREVFDHPRDLRVAGLGCDFLPPILVDPGTLAEHLPGRRKIRLEHGKDVEGNAHGSPSFALSTTQGAVGGTWWNRHNPGTSELPARARREQEFGYEVEVVEGEVNAASVVDPSQSIAAAVY